MYEEPAAPDNANKRWLGLRGPKIYRKPTRLTCCPDGLGSHRVDGGRVPGRGADQTWCQAAHEPPARQWRMAGGGDSGRFSRVLFIFIPQLQVFLYHSRSRYFCDKIPGRKGCGITPGGTGTSVAEMAKYFPQRLAMATRATFSYSPILSRTRSLTLGGGFAASFRMFY